MFYNKNENLSDVITGRAFWLGEHEARLQLCCACVALIKLAHAHLALWTSPKAGDNLCDLVWNVNASCCWFELLRLAYVSCRGPDTDRHRQKGKDTIKHR